MQSFLNAVNFLRTLDIRFYRRMYKNDYFWHLSIPVTIEFPVDVNKFKYVETKIEKTVDAEVDFDDEQIHYLDKKKEVYFKIYPNDNRGYLYYDSLLEKSKIQILIQEVDRKHVSKLYPYIFKLVRYVRSRKGFRRFFEVDTDLTHFNVHEGSFEDILLTIRREFYREADHGFSEKRFNNKYYDEDGCVGI